MNIETYIAFVLATAIILVIPGPTIILVISQAVRHGKRSVVPLVAGVLLGDFTAMSLSLLGLGALMATSAVLFSLFKWIGAMYLFYLGIRLWRTDSKIEARTCKQSGVKAGRLFRRSFVVTALNPKSIAFFVAFLPQFIQPNQSLAPQLTLLGSTFLLLATINAALYAVFAGRLGGYIRKERVRRWLNLTGGGALIGAGVITAAMRRSV